MATGLLDRTFGAAAPAVRRDVAARRRQWAAQAASAARASDLAHADALAEGRSRSQASGARCGDGEAGREAARRLIDAVARMTDAERADLLRYLRPAVAEVVRDVLAADLPDVLAILLPQANGARERAGGRPCRS